MSAPGRRSTTAGRGISRSTPRDAAPAATARTTQGREPSPTRRSATQVPRSNVTRTLGGAPPSVHHTTL